MSNVDLNNLSKAELKHMLRTMGMSLDRQNHTKDYYKELYDTASKAKHKITRDNTSFAVNESQLTKKKREREKNNDSKDNRIVSMSLINEELNEEDEEDTPNKCSGYKSKESNSKKFIGKNLNFDNCNYHEIIQTHVYTLEQEDDDEDEEIDINNLKKNINTIITSRNENAKQVLLGALPVIKSSNIIVNSSTNPTIEEEKTEKSESPLLQSVPTEVIIPQNDDDKLRKEQSMPFKFNLKSKDNFALPKENIIKPPVLFNSSIDDSLKQSNASGMNITFKKPDSPKNGQMKITPAICTLPCGQYDPEDHIVRSMNNNINEKCDKALDHQNIHVNYYEEDDVIMTNCNKIKDKKHITPTMQMTRDLIRNSQLNAGINSLENLDLNTNQDNIKEYYNDSMQNQLDNNEEGYRNVDVNAEEDQVMNDCSNNNYAQDITEQQHNDIEKYNKSNSHHTQSSHSNKITFGHSNSQKNQSSINTIKPQNPSHFKDGTNITKRSQTIPIYFNTQQSNKNSSLQKAETDNLNYSIQNVTITPLRNYIEDNNQQPPQNQADDQEIIEPLSSSCNSTNSKSSLPRQIVISSLLSLLMIFFFALVLSGKIDNINVLYVLILFLFISGLYIYYSKRNLYRDIAEHDYKIIKQKVHDYKVNNSAIQGVYMDDFITYSSGTHNMSERDYKKLILPRLKALISKDIFIIETVEDIFNGDEVIVWKEL